MNILFTICGRAGSKGLKNKNICFLLGIPIVYWTISAIDMFIKSQKIINDLNYDVALNTDSIELKNTVLNNKMLPISFIERKNELGGDAVGKIDVIRDTYYEMKKNKNNDYDIIIDLDITSPLRTKEDICNIVEKFISSNVDVVFSVVESRRNPYFNMVQRDSQGSIKKVIMTDFTSRQQAPMVYDMNASIYAYSPIFLNKGFQLFNSKSEIFEMKDTAVLDIDKPMDLVLIEVIAKYYIDNFIGYKEVYENGKI